MTKKRTEIKIKLNNTLRAHEHDSNGRHEGKENSIVVGQENCYKPNLRVGWNKRDGHKAVVGLYVTTLITLVEVAWKWSRIIRIQWAICGPRQVR